MPPMLELLRGQVPDGAGPLGLQSGDEYHLNTRDFDRRLLELTGTAVGLVNCADHRAAPNSTRIARAYFEALGAEVFELRIEGHGTPDARIGTFPQTDLVYVGGGSPAELRACVRGTRVWDQILERWRAGMGLAGSSAGAMVMCAHMLTPEPGASVPTKWTEGAGPLTAPVAIAPHASARPREWLHEVRASAPCELLALDDHTGVVLTNGREPDVIGPGNAWFVT